MRDFIDVWTRQLVAMAEGIDEAQAKALVTEIYEAALREQAQELAEREAEREE